MPDDFKKVQTGDALHIPAPAYNAFIDTAIAQQRGLTLGGGPQRRLGVSGTVITAYNPTANAIPWHGVVEVLSTEHGEDITVGKSGDAAGAGVYGIALEQIAGSAYGAVALAGGPWKLTVAGSVAPGNQVGPVDGAWTAALAGTPTWEVLRRDTDGIALVRFFRNSVNEMSGFKGVAALNMLTSTVYSRATWLIGRQWTAINTSQELYRAILQFQNPVFLNPATSNSILLGSAALAISADIIAQFPGQQVEFRTRFVWVPTSTIQVFVRGITDPFDIAVDTFDKLSTLSCSGGGPMLALDLDLHAAFPFGAREFAYAAICEGLASLTIYGLQVFITHQRLAALTGIGRVFSTVQPLGDWRYGVLKG